MPIEAVVFDLYGTLIYLAHETKPYVNLFVDLGLDAYFDQVLFSCEAGLMKPDPRIYQRMMVMLNVEPQKALMTGDKIKNDVEGPRSIGMHAVHLDRENNSAWSIATLDQIFDYL